MPINFKSLLDPYFNSLEKDYRFKICNEINDGYGYSVEFKSDLFVLKLEKYRREFDPILYKTISPDKEINLFNHSDI